MTRGAANDAELRVLLVAPVPPPIGGIARWSTLVTRALTGESGTKVMVVDSSPPTALAKPKWTPMQRVRAAAAGAPWFVVRTVRAVMRTRPQIVHIATSGGPAHARDAFVILLARLVRARAVLHLHHGRLGQDPTLLERSLATIAIGMSAGVVCLDDATMRTVTRICERMPGRRAIRQVPNPVAFPADAVPAAQRADRVTFIGWNLASKGLDDLLAAWTALGASTQPYELAVIGSGARAFLDARTHPLPERVTFIGELTHEETLEYLRHSGLLVLPSHSEGFPNVVLEAMAEGTPVLASRVGAIPEMLGDDGYLVDAQDPEGLAERILDVLEAPHEAFARASRARDRARRRYSVETVRDDLVDLWQQVARTGAEKIVR